MILFIDYFGRWPGWLGMFLESCRRNPSVVWCIHTDCEIPLDAPLNVQFIPQTYDDYCTRIGDLLRVRFRPETSYNLCNLKPMLGYLYRDLHRGYDYYGWCDLDVVFGDIRAFYTPQVLTHTAISTHREICSGHFALFRNEPWLHEAFLHIPDWRARIENSTRFQWHESLTEVGMTALFSPSGRTRRAFAKRMTVDETGPEFYRNNYFREQWSTPFTPHLWLNGERAHPENWYWKDGVLTNDRDGERTFLYLHLMNFKRRCWVNQELYGKSPTWEGLTRCLQFDMEQLRREDDSSWIVRIDRYGIHLEPIGSTLPER